MAVSLLGREATEQHIPRFRAAYPAKASVLLPDSV